MFRTERGPGPGFWIATIVAQLVLGILATMLVMWFSRWREFRADRGSARLLGPDPTVRALQRLKAEHIPSTLPDSMQAFGIRTGTGRGPTRLLSSHPPLDARIAALRGPTAEFGARA